MAQQRRIVVCGRSSRGVRLPVCRRVYALCSLRWGEAIRAPYNGSLICRCRPCSFLRGRLFHRDIGAMHQRAVHLLWKLAALGPSPRGRALVAVAVDGNESIIRCRVGAVALVQEEGADGYVADLGAIPPPARLLESAVVSRVPIRSAWFVAATGR